jgi:hypothetical protein
MANQDRSDQGKFMQVYDEPLAQRVRGARFPLSIDAVLGELPDQSDFIRTAVIERLKVKGLLPNQSESKASSDI